MKKILIILVSILFVFISCNSNNTENIGENSNSSQEEFVFNNDDFYNQCEYIYERSQEFVGKTITVEGNYILDIDAISGKEIHGVVREDLNNVKIGFPFVPVKNFDIAEGDTIEVTGTLALKDLGMGADEVVIDNAIVIIK